MYGEGVPTGILPLLDLPLGLLDLPLLGLLLFVRLGLLDRDLLFLRGLRSFLRGSAGAWGGGAGAGNLGAVEANGPGAHGQAQSAPEHIAANGHADPISEMV